MSRECPKCGSNSTSSGLWQARGVAAVTELVKGPVEFVKNTVGLAMHSGIGGIEKARDIYLCNSCESYFFECPNCYQYSPLQIFPTQGKVVYCQECNEKAILKLD